MKSTISRIAFGATLPLLALVSFGGVVHADTGQLSVQGVDAPQQLNVGQSGVWTVHVAGWNDYQSNGQLHYSVVWGDENNTGYAMSGYNNTSVQSVGTFTHVYVRPGTYRVVFTVTDDYGHATQSSVTTFVPGSGTTTGTNGTYNNGNCTSYYDRNCYSQYYPTSTTGTVNTTNGLPAGCTSYYDRNCYAQFHPTTPTYTGGTTNTGLPAGCTSYYDRHCYGSNGQPLNGTGQTTTNCPRYSMDPACANAQNQTTTGGTYTNDYSCYYDRNCYASRYGTNGYTSNSYTSYTSNTPVTCSRFSMDPACATTSSNQYYYGRSY